MTRDTFLTRRWNYTITLAQGLPTFLFVGYGLVSPLGASFEGMVALSVAGAFF